MSATAGLAFISGKDADGLNKLNIPLIPVEPDKPEEALSMPADPNEPKEARDVPAGLNEPEEVWGVPAKPNDLEEE